jgi:uncharacterized Zn-finger protein
MHRPESSNSSISDSESRESTSPDSFPSSRVLWTGASSATFNSRQPSLDTFPTPIVKSSPVLAMQNQFTGKEQFRSSHLFYCELCSKTFAAKGSLKKHQLLHTNLKEHKCVEEGCGAEFNRIDYLRKHNRLRHQRD